MKVTTEDKALYELITTGKTKERKYRSLPPNVISGFLKAVNKFKVADSIESIKGDKGLHYEKLNGKLEGYESVRLNIQYRLIFTSIVENGITTITEVKLIKISNHYGDL